MEIAVIGVNHKETPIDIREKVSFTESKKIEAINYLLDNGIKEVIILSTCNRSEIYIAANNLERKIELVKEFYKEFFSFEHIRQYLFVKENNDAVHHIYNVAVGMDSLVLGEDQILGQVKDALLFSIELGASGKILNKLLREAVTAAKSIKSKFKISENPLSISYIGMKFLKEKAGRLTGKKALIIGAGKMGILALKYLIDEEVDEIYITNRTHNKLNNVINNFPQAVPVEYSERYKLLSKVDILITATSSPHTVIDFTKMPALNHVLHIIDLALPRDVDRKVGNLDKVNLYDIDDLKKISDENKRKRIELSEIAADIIENNIEEFEQWLNGIKLDPVIKSLNNKCKKIEKDTLEYINRKLELNCREKKIIEKMMNSALKRVIREPILNLKDIKNEEKMEEYIDMINQLFNF